MNYYKGCYLIITKMSSINQESNKTRHTCADCKSSARGTCIECYMNDYSYDANGKLKMPSTLHSLQQAYYMEEEWYMSSRRAQKCLTPKKKS